MYAQWLAKRIRQSQAVSIPDQIRTVYGDNAARIVAVLMLVITIPASYQLSLALITQTFTGWSLGLCLLLSSGLAFMYVIKGGLRSDAYANIVQATIMFAGYGACIAACVVVLGTPFELLSDTPAPLRSIPGQLGWTPIIVWFVIALQTFIDPNFHVRTAAAADAGIARRGIVVSVALWIVFDVLQLLVGLYALSYLGLSHGAQSGIYLGLEILPSVWRGLFLAGIIAAVMSALDGYALVSGTIIGHDLRMIRTGEPSVFAVRMGVFIALVIGGAIAYLMPSVIDLIYNAASIAVPAVLAPLLLSFSRYASYVRSRIVLLVSLPAVASIGTMMLRGSGQVVHVLAEPMLIGILVSCFILLIVLRSHVRNSTA
jgi:SSS family solute:Na+ symporter